MPTQPINQQLSSADTFIENAMQVAAIRDLFATIGRDADYFQEGRALLEEARALHNRQQAEYGDQYEATNVVYAQREEVHEAYMLHVRLARIAFRGDLSAQGALQLNGERQRAVAAWLDQTLTFYENVLKAEELADRMTAFGVTDAALRETYAAVQEVAAARREQQRQKGEAQQATEKRDEALDRLAAWMGENQALARVLLIDDPQQLEKLGILAPS